MKLMLFSLLVGVLYLMVRRDRQTIGVLRGATEKLRGLGG